MVFRDVVAPRASEALKHLNEKGSSLEDACYMWWDIFPAYAGCFKEPRGATLEAAILDVQAKVLKLPHAGCKESALHGLGHWQHNNEKKVDSIIQEFLASGNCQRAELIAYAKNARRGMVL